MSRHPARWPTRTANAPAGTRAKFARRDTISALAVVAAVAAAALLAVPRPAGAADALRGKSLYADTNGAPLSCGHSSCHGPDPAAGRAKIQRGANNGPLISSAITRNTGGMGFLGPYVSSTDAADIGAYIANPAVAAAPAATVTPGALTFAATSVGATSASMLVMVANTGASSLNLASASLSGAHAGDYLVASGGSCPVPGSVASGASCTIAVAFRPTTAGARAGQLAIAHNAAGSPSTVSLSGTATTMPQPAVTVSVASLDFGAVSVGTRSTVRGVVVGNAGNANLTLGTITITGPQASEFAMSGGNCGASLVPGGSCTLPMVFAPAAIGARAAALSIPSDAPTGTATVALAGSGQAAPVAAATVNPTSIEFGLARLGVDAPPFAVTLTSTGTAPLQVGLPVVSPANAGFSIAAGNCPATLAVDSSCTVQIGFRPVAAASASATITWPTNALAGAASIGVSGTGIAGPRPAPALTPATPIDFGPNAVGSRTTPRTVSVENRGTVAFRIVSLAIAGQHATDFARAGTCAIGSAVDPSASCTLAIAFAPSAEGLRQASVSVSTDSGTQLAIVVEGIGTVVASAATSPPTATLSGAASGAMPINFGAGGCSMLGAGDADPTLPGLLLAAGLALVARRRRRDFPPAGR